MTSEHIEECYWPPLFPKAEPPVMQTSPEPNAEDTLLSTLTRHKLERAISSRRSLRHIVLLTNAFSSTSQSSAQSSPTSSFYSDVSSFGYTASSKHESWTDESKRQEQEWLDNVLDDLIKQEELEDYIDVSFKESEDDDDNIVADNVELDMDWSDKTDFTAHTELQIPQIDLEVDHLSDSQADDVPELTLEGESPQPSPELSSLSLTSLQLIPYQSSPFISRSFESNAKGQEELAQPTDLLHALQNLSLRLPISVDLPSDWDLQDFGPLPIEVTQEPLIKRLRKKKRLHVRDDIYVSGLKSFSSRTAHSCHRRHQSKPSLLVQSLLLS